MGEVKNLADYQVSIDGVAYDLMNVPPENSPLVRRQKAAILKDLQLEDITIGLARARKLYWCAYNGVAGFGSLRAKVVLLQDSLGQLCSGTAAALDEFQDKSKSVLENLNLTFKYLVDPEQREIALAFLDSSAEAASKLADVAGKLAEKFEKQATDTFAAVSDTEIQKGLTEENKRKFEQVQHETEGRVAGATKAANEYDALTKDYQQKYEDARHDAAVESERAFISSIVSSVIKPFAAGAGAFAQAYAMENPAVAAGTVAKSMQNQNQPQTSDGDDDAQEPAGDQTATTDATDDKSKSGPSAGKKAAAAATAAAADEAAKSLGEASDKAAERAKSAEDRVIVILKAQQEIAKARIEQVSLLAQYAVDLKNISQQIQVTEATVMSLHIAIGALKAVAVSLRSAQQFWQQMRTFCERLNDPTSGMQADIKRMSKFSTKIQDAYFKGDQTFKAHVVTYYGSWLAISLVTAEYREAAVRVGKGVYDDIRKNPDTQQSIGLARDLGTELEIEANAEIAQLKQNPPAAAA